VGKFTTVAERLKPESLFQRFLEFRESLAWRCSSQRRGHRFGVLAQRLAGGGLVCLVSDRTSTAAASTWSSSGRGADDAGPAALAVAEPGRRCCRDALVPRLDWGVRIGEEVRVPETGTRREKVAVMTQEVARRYEDGIRAHPQDWHMLQKSSSPS